MITLCSVRLTSSSSPDLNRRAAQFICYHTQVTSEYTELFYQLRQWVKHVLPFYFESMMTNDPTQMEIFSDGQYRQASTVVEQDKTP